MAGRPKRRERLAREARENPRRPDPRYEASRERAAIAQKLRKKGAVVDFRGGEQGMFLVLDKKGRLGTTLRLYDSNGHEVESFAKGIYPENVFESIYLAQATYPGSEGWPYYGHEEP